MLEDEGIEVLAVIGVTGAGSGAAKLVGLAKERKTAFAFGLPVEAGSTAESSSFSWGSDASRSSSDFLRFGGLGLASSSSAASIDLREAALEPFLDAIVLALALGGPQ